MLDEVRGPHLVLADARREDRVVGGEAADALDDLLGRQGAVGGLLVTERVRRAPAVQVGPPHAQVALVARGVLALDGLHEVGDDLSRVADDRDVGGAVLADLGGVDVGVDDLRERGEAVELAGDAVVEAGAERDDEVGLLERGHGGDAAVHPGHADVLRVAVGEGAEGHQGRRDGGPGQLGEDLQLGGRARLQDPAADVEHGALGGAEEPGGLADLLGVRLRHGAVAGQVLGGRPAERGVGLERVLGDVDEDGARAAGRGDVERLGDGVRDVLGLGDEEAVLRDRHRDADDVRLLEGVRTDGRRGDLPGDGDEGHRVHVGVRDRRDEVGRAGPRGRHAHADLAGGLRVTGRRVARALLVAHQDVPHTGRVHHRVVRGEDRAARDAEDRVGPDLFEGADEGLRTRHALDVSGLLSAGTGPRLRMRGPGGLLGHRHSLLRLAFSVRVGGCASWWFARAVGAGPAGTCATKNPSCRVASEGSASVRVPEFVLRLQPTRCPSTRIRVRMAVTLLPAAVNCQADGIWISRCGHQRGCGTHPTSPPGRAPDRGREGFGGGRRPEW